MVVLVVVVGRSSSGYVLVVVVVVVLVVVVVVLVVVVVVAVGSSRLWRADHDSVDRTATLPLALTLSYAERPCLVEKTGVLEKAMYMARLQSEHVAPAIMVSQSPRSSSSIATWSGLGSGLGLALGFGLGLGLGFARRWPP